jgi:uncharacterized membrane protein
MREVAMVKTIGNPLTWLVQGAEAAGGHAVLVAEDIGGTDHAQPKVQTIGVADIRAALRDGAQDFAALRSDVVVLCLLYPVIGMVLAWFAFHSNLLPLIYPLIAGFALVGPVAGVGLYEMSRRREAGDEANWASAFRVIESPALGAIATLAVYLVVLFVIWMLVAAEIYGFTLGPGAPTSISGFVRDVFTTGPGWTMAILGTVAGFVFALAALSVSLVSFPMMLDRHVGVPVAVATSVEVVRRNPVTAAAWGIVVAVSLALGSVPALLGLVVVLPILAHATWHLYRRAVHWD